MCFPDLTGAGFFGSADGGIYFRDLLFPGLLGLLSFPVILEKLLGIDHELPSLLSSDLHHSRYCTVDRIEKDPPFSSG